VTNPTLARLNLQQVTLSKGVRMPIVGFGVFQTSVPR